MSSQNEMAVLITGAKGGLGSFVTEAFLKAGARVAGVSRSIQQKDFAHPNFVAVAAELSSLEGAQKVAGEVKGHFGRLDVVVHLMGGFAFSGPLAGTDDATFDQMLDVNLKSAFHLFRAVLPVMESQGSGRLLAIGSKAATDPVSGAAAYSVSKAALVSLVRAAAIEYGPKGISANVVLPGTMDTAANRKAMPDADFSKWVQPAQVAGLLVYLASGEASQLNGAVIPIYGQEA